MQYFAITHEANYTKIDIVPDTHDWFIEDDGVVALLCLPKNTPDDVVIRIAEILAELHT